MGDISRMRGITRVIDAHGQKIIDDTLNNLPECIKKLKPSLMLYNDCHQISIILTFPGGESLRLEALSIDYLADEYPDCDVSY